MLNDWEWRKDWSGCIGVADDKDWVAITAHIECHTRIQIVFSARIWLLQYRILISECSLRPHIE